LARVDEVKTALGRHVDITDLSFVELDLASDEGWDAAAKGCTYIQHVASPFPNAAPEHEDDLIIPAREGALRALRAGAKAKVKRVVMTSSIAAVGYGHDRPKDYVYTEDDWSNAEGSLTAYAKSKTIAERAAWDFIESAEAGKMELSVINPGAVLGPLTSADFSPSADMVKKLLDGSVPACPAIGFACIDVRDVADAHYEAMVRPVAKGRRYCLVGEYAWMIDVSKELRKAGYASPTKKLPNIMVHIMGMFNPTIRLIKAGLGKRSNISNERLVKELGITPRSLHEMSTSMAETLVEYEIVSPKML
jgi:dihydroflavonol-4-reductase